MNTSTIRTFQGFLLGALAAVGLGTCVPALAEDDPPSITVKFGDLNLDNRAGAEILYRRLQKAAMRVCDWDRDAAMPNAVHACYIKALDDAVAKVNSGVLNAVHLRKSATVPG